MEKEVAIKEWAVSEAIRLHGAVTIDTILASAKRIAAYILEEKPAPNIPSKD